MTEEMKSKMNEVANSEEFKKEFGKADSPEALAEIFEKFGLEMTAADVEAFMAEIPDEEELDADALDGVAGGALPAVALLGGVIAIAEGLKCNKHTNWGRNGKKCICGMHFF